MNQQEEGRWTLKQNICLGSMWLGFAIFSTIAFETLSSNLKWTSFGVIYLIVIVLWYVHVIGLILEIILKNSNAPETLSPIYKYAFKFVLFTDSIHLFLRIYLLIYLLYQGPPYWLGLCSVLAWVSLQIIIWYTLITLCICGLVCIFLICIRCLPVPSIRGLNVPSPRRLSSFLIKQFPIVQSPPNDNICSICCEDAQSTDQWLVLKCRHKFHPKCIEPWLKQNALCPLCRQDQTIEMT